MCVTSEGYIAHWSTLDSDDVLDHMLADLDLENYIVLYTSKILRKKKALKEQEQRELLNQIVNALG